MSYFYKRRKLNKYGKILALPYLFSMAIGFDVLFFGNKIGLSKGIQKTLLEPLNFQITILKEVGLMDLLEANISPINIYAILTIFGTIILYNIGRVAGKKLFGVVTNN